MTSGDSIQRLRHFVDERWAVVQPGVYPEIDAWRIRPEGGLQLLTPREVADFLSSVEPCRNELPVYEIDDHGRLPSDRIPPKASGAPKGYLFFEPDGTVRLETVVHMAA